MRRRVLRGRSFTRAQVAYAALGLLTVCSLLTAALGTAVVDAITSADDDELEVDAPESDPLAESLRATVEASPVSAQALVSLADYLANTGNLDEAIDWYEQALALDQNDWRTRLAFARDLSDGGKPADAEVQFKRVLVLAPDDAEAHFYLAELYARWQTPRTAEAAAEYRRAIALQPNSFYAQRGAEQLAAMGQPLATPAVGTPVAIGTPVMEATP